MLNTIRILLTILVTLLGSYALITQNFNLMPLTFSFLGLSILINGVIGLKENRKFMSYTSFLAAAFLIFVAIYTAIIR
ncbi:MULTISPECIES: DUF3953 domain-containing protein [Bacillus]|nr:MULTISPECIES: DUF3953 domain-containing protein [Bacillus]MEC2863712.1 DUF3953 domain-containing protein [Bacillus cereus]OUB93419.1 hypothetical protein BK773_08530 [Bacillus thuringiensis serovar indiana]UIJ66058.1 YczI family protein [Bacillus cereus]